MTATASCDLSIQVRFFDLMMVTLAGPSPLARDYARQSPFFMSSAISETACSTREVVRHSLREGKAAAEERNPLRHKTMKLRLQGARRLQKTGVQRKNISYTLHYSLTLYRIQCACQISAHLLAPDVTFFGQRKPEEKELRPIFSLDSGSSLCFGLSRH